MSSLLSGIVVFVPKGQQELTEYVGLSPRIGVNRVYFTQIFYLVILATIFSLIIYPVFVYYLLYNILLYCNF